MQLRIKSLIPFENWERAIECYPEPSAIPELIRTAAVHFEQCHITLYDGDVAIARSRWRAKAQAPDIESLVSTI